LIFKEIASKGSPQTIFFRQSICLARASEETLRRRHGVLRAFPGENPAREWQASCRDSDVSCGAFGRDKFIQGNQ